MGAVGSVETVIGGAAGAGAGGTVCAEAAVAAEAITSVNRPRRTRGETDGITDVNSISWENCTNSPSRDG
jgi:hypothetical protein